MNRANKTTNKNIWQIAQNNKNQLIRTETKADGLFKIAHSAKINNLVLSETTSYVFFLIGMFWVKKHANILIFNRTTPRFIRRQILANLTWGI